MQTSAKAVIMHTIEFIVAMNLPVLINWLTNAGVGNKWLGLSAAILALLVKTAREKGWLPDYASSSTS